MDFRPVARARWQPENEDLTGQQLLSMPPEIFENIITQWLSICGMRHLWSSRRTCKTFHWYIMNELVHKASGKAFKKFPPLLYHLLPQFLESKVATAKRPTEALLSGIVNSVDYILEVLPVSDVETLKKRYVRAVIDCLSQNARGQTVKLILSRRGAEPYLSYFGPRTVFVATIVGNIAALDHYLHAIESDRSKWFTDKSLNCHGNLTWKQEPRKLFSCLLETAAICGNREVLKALLLRVQVSRLYWRRSVDLALENGHPHLIHVLLNYKRTQESNYADSFYRLRYRLSLTLSIAWNTQSYSTFKAAISIIRECGGLQSISCMLFAYSKKEYFDNLITIFLSRGEVPDWEIKLAPVRKYDPLVGTTPLRWAIDCRSVNTVNILLKFGADPNYKKPIKAALSQANPPIIASLIEFGARLRHKDVQNAEKELVLAKCEQLEDWDCDPKFKDRLLTYYLLHKAVPEPKHDRENNKKPYPRDLLKKLERDIESDEKWCKAATDLIKCLDRRPGHILFGIALLDQGF